MLLCKIEEYRYFSSNIRHLGENNLEAQQLFDRYQKVRQITEEICAPLQAEDYQIQSCLEVSPPKWHLAHVSWFFESFVLSRYSNNYQSFHPKFHYIFNSYYQSLGNFHARNKRGNLSRPTIEEVYRYRHYVDDAMADFFSQPRSGDKEAMAIIELGIHHEQQHQELLLMDIKHNFFMSPLKPAYLETKKPQSDAISSIAWHEQGERLYAIGNSADEFTYDNERPQHKVFLQSFQLADRLVSNGEYLEFIQDRGYEKPELWLSDGWGAVQNEGWQHPLYWSYEDDTWFEFSLYGEYPLDFNDPVSHISYFEADAYARWKGYRLPLEAEIEVVLQAHNIMGNFYDNRVVHPQYKQTQEQWFGNLWNWSSSAYQAYPGFTPFAGSAGEYNGKFMCNQYVLRGGSCVTSRDHMRSSYRNFFYPQDRWQFSGIRMAQ